MDAAVMIVLIIVKHHVVMMDAALRTATRNVAK
jgi:hypothetical protein